MLNHAFPGIALSAVAVRLMIEAGPEILNGDAVASADHMPYSDQEPGTVYSVEGERTTTVDDEADSQLDYEFGADKSITSISYTQRE